MILTRYISTQIISYTLAVSSVLLIVTLFGRLIRFLQQVMDGNLPAEFLLQMILFRLPQFLELILPFGLFLGTLVALRRMYSDSEIVVMQTGGLSDVQLLKMVLLPACLMSIFVASLTLYVTPATMTKAYQLLINPDSYLEYSVKRTGRIHVTENGRYAMYIDHIDRDSGKLHDLVLAELKTNSNKPIRFSTLLAREGTLHISPDTGSRFIIFEQGEQYVGQFATLQLRVLDFDRFGKRISTSAEHIPRLKSDALSTWTLVHSDQPKDWASLHWRIAIPMMMPCAAVIALAFSRTQIRRGSYNRIFIAVLLFLCYMVALNLVRNASGKGDVHPGVAFAVVHTLFLVIGIVVLFSPGLTPDLRKRFPQLLPLGGARN
ncbi:MAG: LPS export ABC transporter permease LptF [Pseudomonadales bacterium]|nr:LPS export ABC transporter permease LptF [Pseudomonadales bacterium]